MIIRKRFLPFLLSGTMIFGAAKLSGQSVIHADCDADGVIDARDVLYLLSQVNQ